MLISLSTIYQPIKRSPTPLELSKSYGSRLKSKGSISTRFIIFTSGSSQTLRFGPTLRKNTGELVLLYILLELILVVNLYFRIPSPRREITTRGFRDVHKQIVLMPVGAWHSDPAVQQVGDLIARGFSLAWKQLEPSLIDSGTPPEEASRICSAIIEAYSRSDFHVVGKYHMVYGTKN